MTTPGTSSADPAALRVYVRVAREMDQELLSFARGPLRSALADFRTGCPDAAQLVPELDLLIEQLALRGLRLSELTDRVAADFEAAGGGSDLAGLLRPEVAGDLGALTAEPADAGLPTVRLASFPAEGPLTPLQLPDQSPGAFAGDFLGALWDEVSGSAEGLLHAALHPLDTAHGVLGMLENPGDALRAMADWDDLKSGDQGRWLGHVLPALMLGSVTDGVGLFVRTARLLHRFAQEQEAIQRLAREVGDEAQRLTDQLGRSTTAALLTAKMPASEIRQFVDGFGAARVHELVQKYTAKSLAYYGYEFFKEFRGVTDDTMNHVIKFVRMEKGKIVGCHDRNAFLAALRGNGEIERVVMDSKDANIERIEYRLYKRARDQSVVQPPTLRDGKVRSKTVITNLDPQLWRRRAEEATDRAIREGRLPRDGDEFREFADDGTELTLYFRPPLIDSFFPVLK